MFIDVIPAALTEESVTSSISTLQRTLNRLSDFAEDFAGKLLVAIIIFLVGRFLISQLRKFFSKMLQRRRIDETVRSFLDSLINISLKIILAIIIIGQLGIQTTSFAAMIAAAGLAVGMAMKDNLANFAGGVMILFNRPFKVKDRIQSQGQDGTVQSIGILYTELLTPDNRTIFIPNGPLSTGTIVNYSTEPTRRVDVTFSVGYGVELSKIKEIAREIVASNENILPTPEPVVELSTISNGSIDVTVRVWVKSSDFAAVNRFLNENIYMTLARLGIYTPAVTTVKIINS
ncbi:MAG: mechanosensitive ion channel [Dysgonamonadaceae bacterium]